MEFVVVIAVGHGDKEKFGARLEVFIAHEQRSEPAGESVAKGSDAAVVEVVRRARLLLSSEQVVLAESKEVSLRRDFGAEETHAVAEGFEIFLGGHAAAREVVHGIAVFSCYVLTPGVLEIIVVLVGAVFIDGDQLARRQTVAHACDSAENA